MKTVRQYNQEYYQKHKEQLLRRTRRYYQEHRIELLEKKILYEQEHKEKIAAQKRKYDKEHKQEVRAQHKRWRDKVKVQVLTYYGNGKCACLMCEERSPACLTIDHISGGGRKHRQELKLRGISSFYSWLRRVGYPEGYRTLCMNCQLKVLYECRELR